MNFIPAGKFINTHGVRGDLKAEVWLDSVSFLKKYKRIFTASGEKKVLSCTDHKGFAILRLEGIDDVNEAMKYKESEFSICKDDVKLPDGSFFLLDIIGARVMDEDGREVGILTEILENPAQRIYVVTGETEHLIPAVKEFVRATDLECKCITVHLIEGM